MVTEKKLGIWMDDACAHLMELTSDPIEIKTIESKYSHHSKEQSMSMSEKPMYNNQQHEQTEYYKQLAEVIKNYEEIILFGPSNAKVELYNILRADHHFSKIKIEIKQSDKMTKNQQHVLNKIQAMKQILMTIHQIAK